MSVIRDAQRALTPPTLGLARELSAAPVTRRANGLAPRLGLSAVAPRPLHGDMICYRPQQETRLIEVTGSPEAWEDYDRRIPVSLTRC